MGEGRGGVDTVMKKMMDGWVGWEDLTCAVKRVGACRGVKGVDGVNGLRYCKLDRPRTSRMARISLLRL